MFRLLSPLALIALSTTVVFAKPGIQASSSFRKPLLFMENKGQVHCPASKAMPEVKYHLSGSGTNVSLTATGIFYTFIGTAKETESQAATTEPRCRLQGLSVTLVGANPHPRISAEQPSAYYERYFTKGSGKVSSTPVHGYSRIVYHDIYPHIDWVVFVSPANGRQGVAYDFIVRPGGDPSRIRLKYTGADQLSLNANGSLTAAVGAGGLTEAKPYAYIQGRKTSGVAAHYRLAGDVLGYSVKMPARGTLVIDPQVVWITYYGHNFGWDEGRGVACDAQGNGYVAGSTVNSSNIALPGGYDTSYGGSGDAFLAAFSRGGAPLWATYFGGAGTDAANAIAVDNNGSVYLCGYTQSADSIATAGAHQTTAGGGIDGFIAKFYATGMLQWATYYGGSGRDEIIAARCDWAGNLYIGGVTRSANGIATAGTYQPVQPLNTGLSYDGFVAKFSSSGVRQWGTYYGGSGDEAVFSLCPDNFSGLFITGITQSDTGIASSGSFQPLRGTIADSVKAFLAKLSTATGTRYWGTYYGGSGCDNGLAVACDSAGNIYLAGGTSSPAGIATTGSYQANYGGGGDNFLAKFNTNGSRIWATYYGGSDYEYSVKTNASSTNAVGPGSGGNVGICITRNKVWLSSVTKSSNGIATPGSYIDSLLYISGGYGTPYIASFDTSGARLWATYINSPSFQECKGIAGNASGDVYVAGTGEPTSTLGNLATPGAYQSTFGGVFLVYLIDSVSKIFTADVKAMCEGEVFTLPYYIVAHGVLRSGNVFKIQLSNAAGSFSAPTDIGTLSSATGGSITCTLPAGVSGSGYKIRMVSSLPQMISDTDVLVINPLPQPVIARSGNTLSITGFYSSYQWYLNGSAVSGATSASYVLKGNGQYTVKVTSTSGCVGSSAVFEVKNVGVSTVHPGAVRIYPNPAGDYLVIEGAAAGTKAALTDAAGRKLLDIVISSSAQRVSLAAVPQGLCWLSLSSADGSEQIMAIEKK